MRSAIIARYNEDVAWTKDLVCPYLIINKGEEILDHPYITLPNVGRESDSYLNFIIKNYDQLPQEVIFLQGNPFDHCPTVLDEIRTKVYLTQVTLLAKDTFVDGRNGEPSHHGLPIGDISDRLGLPYKEGFLFGPGAQFIVPRTAITSKSLAWWTRAKAIHDEIGVGPWTFERLWLTIFEYNETV